MYRRAIQSVCSAWLIALAIASRASAATYFVDANAPGANTGDSWEDAYFDLTTAFSLAVSNDTILVAAGTYKPTAGLDRTISFSLKYGMQLLGGFPSGGGTPDPLANPTILSGDIGVPDDPTDNSAHVVVGADQAILDGFTVTKGYWNANVANWQDGAGLYVTGNKYMTIRNCRFVDNHSYYRGAGIFMEFAANSSVGPVISNCVFSGNSTFYSSGQGGGLYVYHRVPITLTDCTFEENSSVSGGAIYGQYVDLLMRGCTFARNTTSGQGGAVWHSRPDLTALTPLRIENCTFYANRSTGGAGGALYLDRSDAPGDRITGCRFFANETTQQGGALYLYRYQGQLEDSLFSGNRSSNQEGGAVASYYSSPQLRRVIATGNTSGWRGGAVYVAGHPSYPASPRLENVLAAGNSATYDGGAISLYYTYAGAATLVNCTIASNRTTTASLPYSGGGIAIEDARVAVSNSIVYGNRSGSGVGHEIGVRIASSRTTWGHSDLAGGLAAAYNPNTATNLDQGGNLDAAPDFASTLTGTWSHDGAYTNASGTCTLRDNAAAWTTNAFVGRLLNPDATNALLYVITANSDRTITILGNTTNTPAGRAYQILDYHLAPASPALDTANAAVAPTNDVAGQWRPRGLGVDMGAYESILTGDSTPTAPVSGLTALGGQAQIQLAWTNPADSDFGAVLILRRTGAAPTGIPVHTNTYAVGQYIGNGSVVYIGPGSNPAPGAPSGFTDVDLADVTTYHYAVFALDRVPNYATAATANATTEVDTTPPAPITGLTTSVGDAQLAFTWTNPPQVDYQGILVLRRTGSAPTGTPTPLAVYTTNSTIGDGTVVYAGPGASATPGAASAWTDTGLLNLTNYHYRFFAYDERPVYSTPVATNETPEARHVLYVDIDAAPGGNGSSWANAYNSLTQALAIVRGGTNLWVAEGTYTPGIARTDTFRLTNDCSLLGGFAGTENSATLRDWIAHPTILSGEIGTATNADNCLHVVTASGADNATIDGFTITRGYAWDSLLDSDPARDGGGLLVNEVGGALATTIRNCRFLDNAANFRGGAIALLYAGGHNTKGAVISNCVFEGNYTFRAGNNEGGAIYKYHYRTAWISDCAFTGNRAYMGGAIRDSLGDLVVKRSTFTANVADHSCAAIFNQRQNTSNLNGLRLEDCTFAANQSTYYGAVRLERQYLTGDEVRGCRFYANRTTAFGSAALHLYTYNGLVQDCLFSGNAQLGSGNGGALTLEYSGATVHNVTIVGTEAHYYGGGIFGSTAAGVITPPRFENVLIAGNLARYAGGGLCLNDFWGNTGTVVNCTIADNRTYEPNATSYGGGGLYLRGCTSTITNSIIHGNTTAGAGPQIRLSDVRTILNLGFTDLAGGTGNIHNPDAAALSTGAGMLDAIPGFQDPQTGAWSGPAAYDAATGMTTFSNTAAAWAPGGLVGKFLNPNTGSSNLVYYVAANTPTTITILGDASKVTNDTAAYAIRDYRLKATSPCVDTGTAAGLTHDLLGQPRPQGAGHDLGAYERVPDGIAPASVSGLSAAGGLDLVALSWTNPASADFAGVLIVRRAGAAPLGEPVSTNLYAAGNTIGNGTVAYVGSGNNAAPGAPSGWTDTALNQLTTYHYAVYALDAVPNYATRADASATTLADGVPPEPVTGLRAVGGAQQITLSWTNSTSADFAGVLILRRDGPTPPTGIPATGAIYVASDTIADGTVVYVGSAASPTPGAPSSWTDTGLANLSRYAYSVFAYDEVPAYATPASDDAVTGLPGVLFVNDDASGANTGSTWDDAFPDLQDALRAATPGNQIWVAAGTYFPTNATGSTAAIFRLRPSVELYGGFAGTESSVAERPGTNHSTILSGDIGTPDADFDNCSRLVHAAVGTDGLTFDGFVLEKAVGNQQGAAMLVSAAITVRNCLFRNNTGYEGAGVHNGANATYHNCIFINNASTHRGGAFQTYSSQPTLINCVFLNNSCDGHGGAMAIYHNSATLYHVTLLGNTAGGSGNAIYFSNYGGATIQNSIFWDTGASGGGIHPKEWNDINESGLISMINSDVRGGFTPPALYTGTVENNIDADPQFVDEGTGDLRLSQNSPCIDTGADLSAVTDDLDNGSRPAGQGYDMGAYEYGSTGPGTPPTGMLLIVR